MDKEQLYTERLNRYTTAMRNEKPDKIPIRPFTAEFVAKYAGYTCQEVTHDFDKAFAAVRKTASDFDWDAVVGNMVYVWTGLTEAIGTKYFGVPGIHTKPDVGFQYLEPPETEPFMRADEYDALIDDPTGFLYNVWLPRVSTQVVRPGEPGTYHNNLSFVKGGMAMMQYFGGFGTQNALLKAECGTVSAIAGIFKAPFDIISDKLRGYIGLTMDMVEQPDKVLKACEALMPHLLHVALTTADPEKKVPIGFWMHRGCVPFITPDQFNSHYWPTMRPLVEEMWANGNQVLFYAEGDWAYHLEQFRELPERSIIYHVDQGDIFKTHEVLGDRYCLSGGIPNVLLSYGTQDEVREACKKVIDEVAQDGGYIMDAGAIMQNDTSIENMQALTDFTREYGVYSSGSSASAASTIQGPDPKNPPGGEGYGMYGRTDPRIKPGICFPWEEKKKELPELLGDESIVQTQWENIEALGNTYIWQCLLSF